MRSDVHLSPSHSDTLTFPKPSTRRQVEFPFKTGVIGRPTPTSVSVKLSIPIRPHSKHQNTFFRTLEDDPKPKKKQKNTQLSITSSGQLGVRRRNTGAEHRQVLAFELRPTPMESIWPTISFLFWLESPPWRSCESTTTPLHYPFPTSWPLPRPPKFWNPINFLPFEESIQHPNWPYAKPSTL